MTARKGKTFAFAGRTPSIGPPQANTKLASNGGRRDISGNDSSKYRCVGQIFNWSGWQIRFIQAGATLLGRDFPGLSDPHLSDDKLIEIANGLSRELLEISPNVLEPSPLSLAPARSSRKIRESGAIRRELFLPVVVSPLQSTYPWIRSLAEQGTVRIACSSRRSVCRLHRWM